MTVIQYITGARRAIAMWLLVLVLAYIVMTGLLFIFQRSLLYLPVTRLIATPESIGLDYEDVYLTAGDGVTIHGWYVEAENSRGTLLFFHGNAGNISHRLESIRIFNQLGLDVFIVDYRGYGSSQGRPSEPGLIRDADAAWGYLIHEKRKDPGEIVLFGRSLGAALSTRLAVERTPGALIIESAFTSVPDMAARLYPIFPVRLLVRDRLSAIDIIDQVRCPILVIHSRGDEIVPYEHGRKLFDAASAPREFLEIRGGHNDGFVVSGQDYILGLDVFISRYTSQDRVSCPPSSAPPEGPQSRLPH